MRDHFHRMILILCAVAALAILSSTMAKNPALPLLAKSIGADDAMVGLIAAISPIPGILISSIAGAYSDRKGRAKILTASLVIFATAPFLYLFITAPWQLIAVRFYHGFATAIFMPVAMAAVADRYSPEQRGEKLGIFSSATMVGRSLAPFMGGALLYIANFDSVYIACAITGILALVLAFAIPWKNDRNERQVESKDRAFASLVKVVRDRRIVLTSSVEGIQYFAMGAFETFLPLYALSLGFNGLEIGAIMGVQIVSMLLSKPLMGRLSDRKGRIPSVIAGLLIGFVSIIALPFVSNSILLGFISIIFGIGVATVTASTSALVSELAGKTAHGSAIGLLSSIMDIGHSIGPFATGIIIGLASFQIGFGIAGTVLLIGAVAFSFGMLGSGKNRAAE